MNNSIRIYEFKFYNNNDFMFFSSSGHESISELEACLGEWKNIVKQKPSYIEIWEVELTTLKSGRWIESKRSLFHTYQY